MGYVDDDTERPHVDGLVVGLGGEDLGGHVARRAAARLQLVVGKVFAEPKVRNFDQLLFVGPRRQQILGPGERREVRRERRNRIERLVDSDCTNPIESQIKHRSGDSLEVAMGDATLVEVFDGTDDLAHNVGRVLLRILAPLDNLVKQLLAVHQLHDEKKLLLALKHVKELQNVGMVHLLHNLNLPAQQLNVVPLHVGLFDALDCVTLRGTLFGALHHDTKASAANLPAKLIVVLDILVASRLLVDCDDGK
jgi:hypothetical protein